MECRDDPLMADESSMPNADSRQYRFAYEIHSWSDIPSDFATALLSKHWQAALFMPGDTEAFWQPPEYPPRIYVLEENRLLIYPHPASADELFEAPLNRLLAVELQKSLLYGVIQFHTASASAHFRYSTVHQKLFNQFLRSLRSHWLVPAEINPRAAAMEDSIAHRSARCLRELKNELDQDENILNALSQPATHLKEGVWFFRRSRTSPALLIALTNRRLISISTGIRDRDDPYEIALRYVSRRAFFRPDLTRRNSGDAVFELHIGDHAVWKYTVREDTIGLLSGLFDMSRGMRYQRHF